MSAIGCSASKSAPPRSPLTIADAPTSRHRSASSPGIRTTRTPGWSATARANSSTRVSASSSGVLPALTPTATTTSSNIARARRTTSRCPRVTGSNDPGQTATRAMPPTYRGTRPRPAPGGATRGNTRGPRSRPTYPGAKMATTRDQAPMTPTPLQDVALLLRPDDDVAIATRDLAAGSVLATGTGEVLQVAVEVPRGHKPAVRAAPAGAEGTGAAHADDAGARGDKLAGRAVPAGAQVHQYGQSIGLATAAIAPGDHVHSHNLGMDTGDREHEFGTARVLPSFPEGLPRTFLGYHRADGRVGTRNYIGVITSVNCSASTAKLIADQFRGIGVLDDYPNVDGVMALAHTSGCGLVSGSAGAELLLRTLRGYARHPNLGGLLVLGLGCEMVPVTSLVEGLELPRGMHVETMTIQDTGGIRATVRAGVEEMQARSEERRVRARS